jgi:very-short-patch-repair endonuclease
MDAVPGVDADEFQWLTYEQSGVVTTPQAVERLGRSAVRTHLRQGRWRSICRGVLCTHNGLLTRRQQLWVAVLVAGAEARLAGVTAAAEYGVSGLRAEPLHVLVPARRNRSVRIPRLPSDMPGIHVHRTALLPDRHRQVGHPPRTSVARSVIDAAAWSPGDREALAIVAASCQQGRVEPAELRDVLAMFPRLRRRPLVKALVADIEGGVDALSELDLVTLCRYHRLPLPALQDRRTDAYGRLRFIDAHWPDHRLQVEIDGAHHMDVRHWTADMLRQNQIWIEGDRILRFPAWLLRSDPSMVVAQLSAALRSPTRLAPHAESDNEHIRQRSPAAAPARADSP